MRRVYNKRTVDRCYEIIVDAKAIGDLLSSANDNEWRDDTPKAIGYLITRQMAALESAYNKFVNSTVSTKRAAAMIENMGQHIEAKQVSASEAKVLLDELAEDIRADRLYIDRSQRRLMNAPLVAGLSTQNGQKLA